MKLVAGLGNPGAGYAGNRHNIGFMALDALHAALAAEGWQKKFNGLTAQAMLGGGKVLLLKPMTFMNRSGQAVQAAAQFYKIAPADIIVLHDELELPPGRLRVKQGGGAAGHNGLKSIDDAIGPDYWRVRLGIGRPPAGREAVHDYVLQDFAKSEQGWLEALLKAVAREAALLTQGQQSSFMNKVTLAMAPFLPATETKMEG